MTPRIPPGTARRTRRGRGLCARWGLGFLAAALLAAGGVTGRRAAFAAEAAAPLDRDRVDAARLMARALDSIGRLRESRGLPIDRTLDPNRTGIIGEEFTPLTTSLGDAAAKRTSANPAFAAVLVHYFEQAHLRRGDVVAVGASGSFPGLLLATLCAAHALGLEPIVVYSVGASMYGANIQGFTFVDMLAGLRADGMLPYRLAAVSPGGDGDGGGGVLFDEGGQALVEETRRSGVAAVGGTTLAESIERRLQIYADAASGRPVRCFVNIGGASANFGDTPASLRVPNGLVASLPAAPPAPTRGLLFEYGLRGVAVVHLLHVQGLARANRLPLDPVPFPAVGEAEVFRGRLHGSRD